MVLYTIVPAEEVLAGFDEDEPATMTIRRGHLVMEVQPISGMAGKVVRLLSSDPADYLDSRWQPGNLVDLIYSDYNSD